MYTCIGDGGNMEGLARWFIDDQPPAYCDDPDRFTPPQYQPSPSGKVGGNVLGPGLRVFSLLHLPTGTPRAPCGWVEGSVEV